MPPHFTVAEYARDQIYAVVGGNKQTYLPTRGGKVVAACLTKELNPRAPEVIICGSTEGIARAGDLLAEQREELPVFIKREVNHWEYQGQYRVVQSVTDGSAFEDLLRNSGRSRSEVSRVVVLERCR